MEETLKRLECQFTWDFGKENDLGYHHILANVDFKICHTQYQNHSTLHNFKAFILQKQNRSEEALKSLRTAEDIIRRDYPSTSDLHMLPTYGNYAWIYYHLDNFFKMNEYLDMIQNICANLHVSEYSGATAEMYAEQGWSYLASGQRNGDHAKKCFERALEMSPYDENLYLGLTFSLHAIFWHNPENHEIGHEAVKCLQQIIRRDPENWEAIVDLYIALKDLGENERGLQLVEDNLPNCSNPEILRKLASTFKYNDPERATAILRRLQLLAPDYHLLSSDFGDIYYNMACGEGSTNQERENMIAIAIEYYTRALELNPFSVEPRLRLAYLYGKKGNTDFQECIYKKLESRVDLSQKYQASLWHYYANFMAYTFKDFGKAIEMYKRSYLYGPQTKIGLKNRTKLEWHINNSRRNGNVQRANEISSFLNNN